MGIQPDKFLGLRPGLHLDLETDCLNIYQDDEDVGGFEIDSEATGVLRPLLSILNGNETAGNIIDHLESRGLKAGNIRDCLATLWQTGLLYQYAKKEDRDQAARYAVYAADVESILQRIADSRVWIGGSEGFCHSIMEGLTSANVAEVDMSAGLDKAAWPCAREAEETHANLYVLFGATHQQAFAMNSWCRKMDKPLFCGWWEESEVHFSPVIDFQGSPCLMCTNTAHGRIPYPESDAFITRPIAGNRAMIQSCAYWAAGRVVDFLSGTMQHNQPYHHHVFDVGSGDLQALPVLKNPRCSVCSRLHSHPEISTIHV